MLTTYANKMTGPSASRPTGGAMRCGTCGRETSMLIQRSSRLTAGIPQCPACAGLADGAAIGYVTKEASDGAV